jgi:plasmid stabilization system protein ParE
MSQYRLTPQAVDDLFQIWSYVAKTSVEAANRVEEAILATCESAANSPLAGSVRDDLTDRPVRFWLVQPWQNYWVVYDPSKTPIHIIRILHASRDVSQVLE